jgi:putative phosphonate metabolism protein
MSGERRERARLWIPHQEQRLLDAAPATRHKRLRRHADGAREFACGFWKTRPAAAGRYAVYWAPPKDSVLARLGAGWLGRDGEGGAVPQRPPVAGFGDDRLDALTAEPRRYALHATLKPPFALAEATDPAMLRQALAGFAAAHPRVLLPALRLTRLDRFIALTPSAPCPALDALAAGCVTAFDRFRAPPLAAELARRRAAGLSPAEEAHLARWGYPYVLDCFRFHVTLTGPLEPAEAERLAAPLTALFQPAMETPIALDDIALFHEPSAGTPFRLIERFALRDTATRNNE